MIAGGAEQRQRLLGRLVLRLLPLEMLRVLVLGEIPVANAVGKDRAVAAAPVPDLGPGGVELVVVDQQPQRPGDAGSSIGLTFVLG